MSLQKKKFMTGKIDEKNKSEEDCDYIIAHLYRLVNILKNKSINFVYLNKILFLILQK